MLKNKLVKKSLMLSFAVLMIMSSYVMIDSKADTVPPQQGIQLKDATYSSLFYAESVEIFPFRSTAAGVHAGFIGGSVTLPFDLTTAEYNNLLAFSLVLSNQRTWRNYAPRRFWDVADGAFLMLVFRGDPDLALDRAREIKDMVGEAYGFNMYLVFGHYENTRQITMLVYQGWPDPQTFEDFTGLFPSYVENDGLGKGITVSTLLNAPVKAMSISLYRGPIFRMMLPDDFRTLFPTIGLTPNFMPLVECAWINPAGLQKTGSIMEMNLTRLLPGLGGIVAPSAQAKASFVGMKLPYVVDVLEIDPPTDNMYAHLKGEFEWTLKLDLGFFNYERLLDDIYVKYDLNITGLKYYPQVIGEMALNPSSSLMGGGDIIFDFTFTNVGNEAAYNITMGYGEFNKADIDGFVLPMNNPELTFVPHQIMYYDNNTGLFTSTFMSGPSIGTLEGWFFNTTAGDWHLNNQYLSDDEMEHILDKVYMNETFLDIDPMDFTFTDKTNESYTLTALIPQLDPNDTITLSFAVRNLPTGTLTLYDAVAVNATHYQILVNKTVDWDTFMITLLQGAGSTLHLPEDQVTWSHWFPDPVIGSGFLYKDQFGVEFFGLTNGLVIQLYDDEAILVGQVSLDKDVYRFGEDVNFTLKLTNIGDANATNINYSFCHAFLTEDFNIPVIKKVPDSDGVIDLIKPGESKTISYSYPAETDVGLHPVFAIFNYTSDETTDPDFPAIFSSVNHPAVFSNIDFAMVLPPPHKEGTTEPVYPTPEVNVTTEILGYTPNVTTVGDMITLRTTITNIGDEDTNIIYRQYLPRRLHYVDDSLKITIDGTPVTQFEVIYQAYQPNVGESGYNPFMPSVTIYGETIDGALYGIPLGVGETLVIKANFTIGAGKGIEQVDWNTLSSEDLISLYIPPAEVRYFSRYQIQETRDLNDDTEVPVEEESVETASFLTTIHGTTINSEPGIDNEWASTNSWGSYSDSLSLFIEELSGLGINAIYYGAGIILVTGVAILIYFKAANGKKR